MIPDSTTLLAAEVARDIVSEVAGDELPLFEVSRDAFLTDPRRANALADDEMLGFGGGAELELLTPVVLSISSGIVTFLVKSALTTAKTESQAVIQARVRQWFRRFRADDVPETSRPAPLTQAQLAEVRQVALDVAARMRVPPDKASLLADAAVGQLVFAH